MESEGSPIEPNPVPLDISESFLSMDSIEFLDFLRSLKDELALSIAVDWPGVDRARALKAFVEGARGGQKRFATIRATETQKNEEPNVFASGVRWEKVETPAH